jgi:predicted HAD superfamily phosphohydrolase YqeG
MKKFFKPNLYELSIFDIDLDKLKEIGIKGFIFDVDNTLIILGFINNEIVAPFCCE